MFPKVVRVVPTKNYDVRVYFDDGKTVLYDVKKMMDTDAFAPLRDINTFITTCTILNDTLAWDIDGNGNEYGCIDIDPDTLYALPDCSVIDGE